MLPASFSGAVVVPDLAVPAAGALGSDMTNLDPEMVELALLLPRWQAIALENAARERGLGAGQMLRRMIAAVVGGKPPVAQL